MAAAYVGSLSPCSPRLQATFYDKQWNATWEGQERPSDN